VRFLSRFAVRGAQPSLRDRPCADRARPEHDLLLWRRNRGRIRNRSAALVEMPEQLAATRAGDLGRLSHPSS